ncbi:hypothetical protein Pla100_21150 [Neorhodopirellula pilleata]|uniref:Uncharacterized protein n=1 Tax=Neorhodopirellula pilleata TaxID=2714738 RepID=A0A5C6AH60_9BACT|nr:hypothetical protein Pla100_21150 [Neorhodopirellula pilleata]
MKRGTVVPTVILDGGPSSHVADTLKPNVVEALVNITRTKSPINFLLTEGHYGGVHPLESAYRFPTTVSLNPLKASIAMRRKFRFNPSTHLRNTSGRLRCLPRSVPTCRRFRGGLSCAP